MVPRSLGHQHRVPQGEQDGNRGRGLAPTHEQPPRAWGVLDNMAWVTVLIADKQ